MCLEIGNLDAVAHVLNGGSVTMAFQIFSFEFVKWQQAHAAVNTVSEYEISDKCDLVKKIV
jgi:hypothetical protein